MTDFPQPAPAPDFEPKPFLPLPPNSCTLGVRTAQDGVHTFLRLTHDVTAMSEDGQKLLAYMVGEAFDALKKAVSDWNRIEVAKKLAQRERVAAFRLGEKTN